MTYSEMRKSYENKVRSYNLAQCMFALDDCHKAMRLNPDDTPYHTKLWAEIDALRDRQMVLKKEHRPRPELTPLEQELLASVNALRGWVIHKLEPIMSGTGEPYAALRRDMELASKAIASATGGNEE